MSTAISVRLPEKLAMDIDEIALETERARSFHIQKAVGMYIKEYADLYVYWISRMIRMITKNLS